MIWRTRSPAETGRPRAEAPGQLADLAAARNLGQVHVLVPAGDLVGGPREGEHRARDPPREVAGEARGDPYPRREGQEEPLDQREPALVELRPRLCDQDRAENLTPGDLDRPRHRKERLATPGRPELESTQESLGRLLGVRQ